MSVAKAKIYRVKNLFEAAYLHAHGFPILRKEPAEGERKWFVLFEETEELTKAIQDFYSRRCRERELFESFRLVKDFVYDNNR